jgi:hypothetical protein
MESNSWIICSVPLCLFSLYSNRQQPQPSCKADVAELSSSKLGRTRQPNKTKYNLAKYYLKHNQKSTTILNAWPAPPTRRPAPPCPHPSTTASKPLLPPNITQPTGALPQASSSSGVAGAAPPRIRGWYRDPAACCCRDPKRAVDLASPSDGLVSFAKISTKCGSFFLPKYKVVLKSIFIAWKVAVLCEQLNWFG